MVAAPPLRSPSVPTPAELPPRAGTARRQLWVEAALAVVAFAVMCIAVLSVAAQTAEPDDGAYRASIVAITEGHFLTLSTAEAEALAAKAGRQPGRPSEPVGPAGQRPFHQREGPRLSVPGRAVPATRPHPLGTTVLRGARMPRALPRRPALARQLRWRGRSRPVLLIGRRTGVLLARLHADVRRRLIDRGRLGHPAVDTAGDRSKAPKPHVGRSRRIRGPRTCDVRPLHQHCDPGQRRRGRDRGMANGSRTPRPPPARRLAPFRGRVLRRPGPLR